MIKRAVWLAIGTCVGFTSSFWVSRWVRRRVEQVLPDRLARRASGAARRLGHDLRAATAEARTAMREREAALRAEFDRR